MGSAALGAGALALAFLALIGPGRGDDLRPSGYHELGWRGRTAGDKDDQDLAATLVLEGSRRELGYYVHARGLHDLDGLAPRDRIESFAGPRDTWSDRTHGDLYSAYVDLGGDVARGRPLVRLGRQWRYRAETLQYDGATFTLRPPHPPRFLGGLEVSALGGLPVHPYEGSPAGDWLYGAGLRARVAEPLELGGDYLRVREALADQDGEARLDELVQGSAVLRAGEDLVVRGESSWADGLWRRGSARGSYDLPDWGLGLTGALVRQEETLRELVTEVSPVLQVLGERRPYSFYRLAARQDLVRGLQAELEGTLRDMDDQEGESTYNHDYARYRAGLLSQGLLAGLDLDAWGEAWQAPGSDGGGDARTAGGSLGHELPHQFRVEAGTEYALYQYDELTGRERERVRTWSARLVRRVREGWGLRLGYAFEQGELEDFQVGDLSVRRSF
ncbi:MAG: hypothetical protein HY722_10755 [Planctomycetes bacterium]|nr:hypothetical protein [Planctomycetota bacterium]